MPTWPFWCQFCQLRTHFYKHPPASVGLALSPAHEEAPALLHSPPQGPRPLRGAPGTPGTPGRRGRAPVLWGAGPPLGHVRRRARDPPRQKPWQRPVPAGAARPSFCEVRPGLRCRQRKWSGSGPRGHAASRGLAARPGVPTPRVTWWCLRGKKMRENHKISPGGVAFLPHGCLLVLFSTREAMVKDDARWPRASVSQDTTRMGEEKNKEKKKRKELNPKLVKQHVLIGDETPQVECHQV